MPVSFAPTSKPYRNTNSIPVRVSDSQPADSTISRPAAESSEYVAASHDTKQLSRHRISTIPAIRSRCCSRLAVTSISDIPDRSFPTLNNDDTKKEQ